jgi:transcription elongation GreA/GreB family factor
LTARRPFAIASSPTECWPLSSTTSRRIRTKFGTSVTILRDDGREQTLRIVGEDEADPAQGSISHVSPLARSTFGKRVGDVVQAGVGEAEIIGIE